MCIRDRAWFPEPARSVAAGCNSDGGSGRQVASSGERNVEGQHRRTSGTTPSQAARSPDDRTVAGPTVADARGARKKLSSNNDVRPRPLTNPVMASEAPLAPQRSLSSPPTGAQWSAVAFTTVAVGHARYSAKVADGPRDPGMAGPAAGARRNKKTPKHHPADVAWFPEPARSVAAGRNSDGGSGRQVASSGEQSVEGQHRRTSGTTPRQTARSPDDRTVAGPAVADARRLSSGAIKKVSSDDDVRPRSSANPVTASKAPLAPRRSLSSPSTGPHTSQQQLDKQLRDRLDKLRLPRDDVSENKNTVNELCTDILNELESNSHRSLCHWEIMNSGSYYDKTKV